MEARKSLLSTFVGDVIVQKDLNAFRGFWPSTMNNAPARRYAFQCTDVLDVWCCTIGRARNITPLFVAVLGRDGKPALLLPLGMERQNGVKVLRFLDGGVSDFNAPVLFPGAHDIDRASALAMWRQIQSRLPDHDLVCFEKMPQQVHDWPNPLGFLSTGHHTAGHYSMTLSDNWKEIEKTKLPSHSDSRRRLRNLSKLGEVTFTVAKNHGEAQSILSAMMEMKRTQYLRTQGRDKFIVERGFEDYYTKATHRLFDTGTIHLAALKLNSQILAAHWGYVVGDRFYHLMPAFRNEPDWRAYAPGKLLNEFLMKWSAENGLKVFDFGIGDEGYKAQYADCHEPLLDAVIPVTLAGKTHALVRTTRASCRNSVRGTILENTLRRASRALNSLDGKISKYIRLR